jgi:hypothetical protein
MMQEIEFILHPDGRIEERVTGIQGKDCVVLTQALEEKLGVVKHAQPTQDFYQTQVAQTLSQWV